MAKNERNGDTWVVAASFMPAESGWYAILVCWDPEEGYFPNADFFDGETWHEYSPRLITYRSPTPFMAKEPAHAWAYTHDLHW